ncbi:MAG: cation:proton antiporter [Woeseiaceae bacterium]|nr:cation:proton antiporter [Woeseiaceae bacterium]
METHVLLLQIAAILVVARLFAEIAARFNTPRVIGELCAGILLGPSILGWIEPSDPIKLLAEIGIILLLFEIGLETDLGRMIRSGPRALVLALGGFVAPFILGAGLCYYTFDLPLLVSLFVGGTLTATSIGVTVRVLADLGRHNSNEGQIVLGAAVVDDILGVILLAVLYEFSIGGAVSLVNAGWIVMYVSIFFILAPIAAKLISYAIHHIHQLSDAPGFIPTALVALVLSFAALAHFVGAPELLGGFAAGIALSRRFFLPLGLTLRVSPGFNRRMHDRMKPIIQLFTPIFFVMVGLSLDLSAVDWSSPFIWVFSIVVTVVAIVGKLAGGLLVPENHYARVAIGMAMVPRGEVGLIFAELGRISGIFSNEIYAGMVIVVAYTTLLSPFWIKLYYRFYGDKFAKAEPVTVATDKM